MLVYEKVRVVARGLTGSGLFQNHQEDSFQQKLTIKGGYVAIDRHMQSGLQLDSPTFPAVRLVCFDDRFFPHKFPASAPNTNLFSNTSATARIELPSLSRADALTLNSESSTDIFYKP